MKKKVLIISSIIIILVIGILIFINCHKDNYEKMSDEEFLISIGTWQNDIATKSKYIFYKDGKGSSTIDSNSYNYFSWQILKGKLILEYDNKITENYDYLCNKKIVELTLTKDGSSMSYYKDGTISQPEIYEDRNNKLFGIWKIDDKYLVLDESISGYGYADNDNVYITNEIEWGTDDSFLETISQSGIYKKYQYKIEDKKFKIFIEHEEVRNYVRVEGKYNIKKV